MAELQIIRRASGSWEHDVLITGTLDPVPSFVPSEFWGGIHRDALSSI